MFTSPQRERNTTNRKRKRGSDIMFNDPYRTIYLTISLLVISARRKSREPDPRLEHPAQYTISATVQTRRIGNPPEQFSDELAEIYPFVRDKVKGQFTSVPATVL